MLLVLILIIAGLMSIIEFQKVGSSVDTVMENNYKSVEQTKLMLDALERQDSGLLMFLMGNKTQGSKTIFSADSLMNKALEAAKNNITERNEAKYIEIIYQEYEKLYSSIKKTTEKENVSSLEERNRAYFLENQQLFFAAKEAVYALMKLNEEGIYRQITTMKDSAKRAVMPVMVSIVVAIIFAVLLNFFINEYFIKPINRLINSIKSYYPEMGRIDAKINLKDEIKLLESEINNLIVRFKVK